MSRSRFRGRAREDPPPPPPPCFQTRLRSGWPIKFFLEVGAPPAILCSGRQGPPLIARYGSVSDVQYNSNFSWMSMSIAFMIIVVQRFSSEFFSSLCSWRGLHLSILNQWFNVDREGQWMVILLEIVAFLLSFYPITLQVLPSSCYKQSTIYHTLTEWMPLFCH